jgi:TonB family protein
MVTRRLAVASAFALIVVGPVAGQQQPPRDPSQAPAEEAAVRPGAGIRLPTIVRQAVPRYTPAAMAARIAGSVELEVVVSTDGTVRDIRIVRSLDKTYGLDAEAVRAAQRWLFTPGRRADGQPVPVIVTLILEFNLDKPRSAEQQLFDAATADDVPGLVKPEVIKSVDAKYTSDAMRARLEGVVQLEVVVLRDGTVGAARVVRSLDTASGLDDEALRAVRAWVFRPGSLNGETVSVLARVNIAFRIK